MVVYELAILLFFSEETATSGPEIPASSQTHAAVTLTPRKGIIDTIIK